MKKYIGISLSLVLLATPLSAAFARDGGQDASHDSGTSIHADGQFEIHASARVEDNDTDMDEHATGTLSAHASTTPWLSGEKRGLEKHFATTTPPGFTRDHDATSTDEGTSTRDREDKSNNGHQHGPFAGFWQWLFGHASTTTVADLKAELSATTTASTTGPGTQHAKGEGFFSHLMNIILHKGE